MKKSQSKTIVINGSPIRLTTFCGNFSFRSNEFAYLKPDKISEYISWRDATKKLETEVNKAFNKIIINDTPGYVFETEYAFLYPERIPQDYQEEFIWFLIRNYNEYPNYLKWAAFFQETSTNDQSEFKYVENRVGGARPTRRERGRPATTSTSVGRIVINSPSTSMHEFDRLMVSDEWAIPPSTLPIDPVVTGEPDSGESDEDPTEMF